MSSRASTIIAPTYQDPTIQAEVWVDGANNALLVKVVNPGGGGGGSVQYLEDSAHVSGDTGTMALVVRKDTPGTLAGTDGDYAPLQVDATGALRVTSAGGGGGGTQYQEDAAHVSGDTGTLALVVRKDAPGALAGTDGDYAPFQVDATGRLRVAVDASVVVAVSQSGAWTVAVSNFPATQPVSGTITALQGTSPWVVSGSVNVLDVIPGIGTLNLGKQINQASAPTDVGVAMLGLEGGTAYGPILLNGGAVTINDGGNIITVDGAIVVNQITPGTGATHLGKAEDAVHASGDVGVMALAVRSDAGGAFAANGDYVPFSTDSVGSLRVAATSVIPGTGVTNLGKAAGGAYAFSGDVGVAMLTIDSGTLTWQPVLSNGNVLQVGGTVAVSSLVPGTAATSLGKAEDAVHASGDVGVMALAVRNDSGGGMAANGDYHPIQVDASGRLRTFTFLRDGDGGTANELGIYATSDGFTGRASGLPVMYEVASGGAPAPTTGTWSHGFMNDTNGGILVHVAAIDGQVAVNVLSVIPGTTATALGKAEDAAHTSGDVGVLSLAVRQDTLASSTSATGDYAALKVDSLGALYVNMGNPTSLADGQLASSLGVLLTASGYTSITSIDIFNTSGSLTETVRLHLQQNGGTSRQVRQYSLGPGESVQVIDGDVWHLENGDEIEGFTTTASTVNFFVTGIVR